MFKYEITYDLNSPGQNYLAVEKKIKEAGPVLKIQRTTWLLRSNWKVTPVRNHIAAALDSNDQLMVVELTGVAAWSGYISEGADAIKRFLEAA